MRNRVHALYEQYLMNQENSKKILEAQQDLMKKQSQEKNDFFTKLNKYRTQKELDKLKKVGLEEAVYNDMLGTAFKAVYITSLGELSERAEILANNNIDTYIKENGGARNIIRNNSGKTCLLDTLFEFVNDATLAELENYNILTEAENRNKKNVSDDEAVNPVKGDDPAVKAIEKAEKKVADNQAEDQEDLEQETDEEPTPVDDKGNDIPTEEDQNTESDENADDDQIQQQDEEVPEDTEEDQQQDDTESASDDVSTDEPLPELKDTKEDLFNRMENEDDITAAVDLISQRVQDAETEFIKKNAQDKKKIEKIIDKLSNRLDGATDQATKDNALDVSQAQQDAEAAQTAQQEATRMIRDTRNAYHGIFEEMVKDNANYIMKNNVLRESYIDNGQIDMASIVESSKVMYGFLEFVNTMKLEKVDENFIQNILNNG